MYKFFAPIMKRILPILALLLVQSCSLLSKIPREEVHIIVRDSVAISVKDSINWIPKEKIVDVVAQYDTLNLETSLAKSQAYVDTTTHTLKGKIENKQGIQQQYKEKIIYREHRDTLWREKEVPVEVEKIKEVVPRWAWYLLALFVLEAIYIGIRIFIKIKLDNPTLFKKN